MTVIKSILVRSSKTPVLLGIGKQSEIIEAVKTERGFNLTPQEGSPCLLGKDDFGSECGLVLLEKIPENESKRTLELSCWAAAIIGTLVDMTEIDKAVKPAFLKRCTQDLIMEVLELHDAEEEARVTLRRSVSKQIVPLKEARNKCSDPETKGFIEQKIKEAEAAKDKDAAKAIIEAAKEDPRIKPLLSNTDSTPATDSPAV